MRPRGGDGCCAGTAWPHGERRQATTPENKDTLPVAIIVQIYHGNRRKINLPVEK